MTARRILLSIKPEYADKILDQTKKFEYRKNRCKFNIDTIVIYSTHPVMRVVGEVEVLCILEDSPDNIWKGTKDFSGVSKKFFDSYFQNSPKAVAYKLGKIKRYRHPMHLHDFGIKSAPQSFIYLAK